MDAGSSSLRKHAASAEATEAELSHADYDVIKPQLLHLLKRYSTARWPGLQPRNMVLAIPDRRKTLFFMTTAEMLVTNRQRFNI